MPAMNFGEAEEPSLSPSQRPSTARRAATFAIPMATLSKLGKASRASLTAKGATQANASRREAHEIRKGWYQPGSQAKRNRLRRMLRRGRMVVASAQMRRMRSHRLLRQFTKSACIETFRRYRSPGYHELRAGRAVVLRLSYGGILRRPETSRSSRASVGSTGARTGRTGAFKLANAASRIGGGSLVRPQAKMISAKQ